MKRRSFIKWFSAVALALAVDPVIGGQAIWGTDKPKPELIGVKGSAFLDSGYIWAPYVPLQITPSFLDDYWDGEGCENSIPRRARYDRKSLRTDWYGTITITDVS